MEIFSSWFGSIFTVNCTQPNENCFIILSFYFLYAMRIHIQILQISSDTKNWNTDKQYTFQWHNKFLDWLKGVDRGLTFVEIIASMGCISKWCYSVCKVSSSCSNRYSNLIDWTTPASLNEDNLGKISGLLLYVKYQTAINIII